MSADFPELRTELSDKPVPIAHPLDDGIQPAMIGLAIRNRQLLLAARAAKEQELAGPPRGIGTGLCVGCARKISRNKPLCLECRQDLERRIEEEKAAKEQAAAGEPEPEPVSSDVEPPRR